MDRCQKCGIVLSSSADFPPLCAKCLLQKQIDFSLNAFGTVVVETKPPTCKWQFDRNLFEHYCEEEIRTAWKTECGREFDRMDAGEQPRKHLNMEFCPFCGGHIIDMTTDC